MPQASRSSTGLRVVLASRRPICSGDPPCQRRPAGRSDARAVADEQTAEHWASKNIEALKAKTIFLHFSRRAAACLERSRSANQRPRRRRHRDRSGRRPHSLGRNDHRGRVQVNEAPVTENPSQPPRRSIPPSMPAASTAMANCTYDHEDRRGQQDCRYHPYYRGSRRRRHLQRALSISSAAGTRRWPW